LKHAPFRSGASTWQGLAKQFSLGQRYYALAPPFESSTIARTFAGLAIPFKVPVKIAVERQFSSL